MLIGPQKKGLKHCLKNPSSALFMDMRTGKTVVTMAVLEKRARRRQVETCLVIAPASVLHVWEKWSLRLPAVRFFIISYEGARAHYKRLKKIDWDCIVVDESHKLRNRGSSQSRRISKLNAAPYKMILTGTPTGRKGEIDLWAQFRFCAPGLFGDHWSSFQDDYLQPTGFGGYDRKFRFGKKRQFLKKAAPIVFRITQEEMGALPPAPPLTLYADLTGKQLSAYRDMQKFNLIELQDSTVTAPLVITQQLRLQQIAGGFTKDDDGNIIELGKAKLNVFADWLDNWSEKAIVFARYHWELDQLAKIIKAEGLNL